MDNGTGAGVDAILSTRFCLSSSDGRCPHFDKFFQAMKTQGNLLPALLIIATQATAQNIPLNGSANTTVTSERDQTQWSISSRSAHENRWNKVEYEVKPDGSKVPHVRSYVEIATGLNYRDPKSGAWLDSREEIEILPEGGAAALHGQSQVYFPGNIYDGVIEIITPDGQRLKNRPLGISYFDGTNSVLIAELTNSIGQILPSGNQVIYTNCFTDFEADLLLTYRKSGIESDLIFRQAPVEPAQYNLDPAITRMQLLTEFFETSTPNRSKSRLNQRDHLTDTELAFGSLRMIKGRAFEISNGHEESEKKSDLIPVYKSWEILSGRTFLIEEVPFENLRAKFQGLSTVDRSTKRGAFNRSSNRNPSPNRVLPPMRLVKAKSAEVQQAKLDLKSHDGVVLDYVTVNGSLTNFVFRGDTTYYVSGPVYLYSSGGVPTVVEGNTTVKYAKNVGAKLVFDGPVDFRTDFLSPAIFTALDDRSVGEAYSLGSGSPSGYYAVRALEFDDESDTLLRHVRISYAQTAVYYADHSSFITDRARHVQVRNCGTGFYVDGTSMSDRSFHLENGLMASVTYPFGGFISTGIAEHLTIDRCDTVADDGNSFAFTNCLFANVTNSAVTSGVSADGTHNAFYNATAFGTAALTLSQYPFQTVKDGGYYLATGSTARNYGSESINSDLRLELAKLTTYPPISYTNVTFSQNTTFSPQAQRDVDAPDCGYHYIPLDYLFGGCHANADLTASAGTSLGWFRTGSGWYQAGHGIHIGDNRHLTFSGTAAAPVYWVRTPVVQEVSGGAYGGYGPGGITGWAASVANSPVLNMRFTVCSTTDTGGESNPFRDDNGYLIVSARDCEFYAGNIGGYIAQQHFTNCLMVQVSVGIQGGAADPSMDRIYRNCTFYKGNMYIQRWSPGYVLMSIRDCAFDSTSFSIGSDFLYGDATYNDYDYNAYTNSANPFSTGGSHDVQNVTFSWSDSYYAAGHFFLPWSSPLKDAGSTTADSVGLYHFTTDPYPEYKEANSIVDIGYHYVCYDYWGNPLDTDGDGISDYLEDLNGNGGVDSGESDWQDAADQGFKVWVTRPKNSSTVP